MGTDKRGNDLPVVELAARRNSLHPWIFQKMVNRPKHKLRPGTLVTVMTREGEFIGRGIYNPNGGIAVRLLTELESEPLDRNFFFSRLRQAKHLREEILRVGDQSDSYRLVHAEGDGLSGLIIDKYADVLVIEPYSAGYVTAIQWIDESLRELYPGCRIAVRPDAKQSEREGVTSECADLERRYPAPDSVTIRENAIRMKINFKSGHKTGYFLDQRDNRLAVARMSPGRSVLDLFCYTGGFSISAAAAKASSVTGVDLDENALSTAKENSRLNGVRPEFIHLNVFDYLRKQVEEKRQYDLIVVDPSKLAGVRDEISRGKKTYGDLNRLAMKAVRPGGVLVTCSCSGLISEPDFLAILTRAAAEAGVIFQAFQVAGASSDHPVTSIFPEGRYLKSVLARIQPGTDRRIVSEERKPRA